MENIESRKPASRQPAIASSCGTGELTSHHQPDPALSQLREARRRFDGGPDGKGRSAVSHVVDAGDSGGYVTPYEIDLDDDAADRLRRDDEAE